MKVLIVGAAGHLGVGLVEELSPSMDLVALTRASLDVREVDAVRAAIERAAPDAVINCSAFTDVDRAEDEPVEALDVNAFAVRVLAAESARAGAVFVHFSTDFVFDGAAAVPYAETDRPNPRSTYACSKLIGEWFAREAPRHYVLRVESVFGEPPVGPGARRTSVDRIVDAITDGREAAVFTDRTVSPSYSRDVGAAVRQLFDRRVPFGLYHCVNTGSCTWEELAREVGRVLGVEPRLRAIRLADAKLRAERPLFCALSNTRLAAAGVIMPRWQDALARYLDARRAALLG